MRTLIRSTRTGLFYRSEHEWTGDMVAARDFVTSARAIQLAFEWRLKEVEVVLAFDDPRYNLAMRLNTRPEPPEPLRLS